MGVQITGQVLKVERRAGNFTNDQGEKIDYDYTSARLLVDGSEVVDVKFKSNRPDVQPPEKGATVTLEIELPRNVKPVAVGYFDGKRAA